MIGRRATTARMQLITPGCDKAKLFNSPTRPNSRALPMNILRRNQLMQMLFASSECYNLRFSERSWCLRARGRAIFHVLFPRLWIISLVSPFEPTDRCGRNGKLNAKGKCNWSRKRLTNSKVCLFPLRLLDLSFCWFFPRRIRPRCSNARTIRSHVRSLCGSFGLARSDRALSFPFLLSSVVD